MPIFCTISLKSVVPYGCNLVTDECGPDGIGEQSVCIMLNGEESELKFINVNNEKVITSKVNRVLKIVATVNYLRKVVC